MRNDVSALTIVYLRTIAILATRSTNFTPRKIRNSAPFITIFSQEIIHADTPKAAGDSSQSASMVSYARLKWLIPNQGHYGPGKEIYA